MLTVHFEWQGEKLALSADEALRLVRSDKSASSMSAPQLLVEMTKKGATDVRFQDNPEHSNTAPQEAPASESDAEQQEQQEQEQEGEPEESDDEQEEEQQPPPVEAELPPSQHYQTPILLELVRLRLNTYLVGPSGSGKTTSAEWVAETVDLPFYAISVGAQTTKSDIMGYRDAHGNYVETVFRKAYEHGGVFLLDEIDAGNANVLTQLNAAIANGQCSFPDGMIRKHPDFVCIAAANTFGTGASREYVGRNQLDAATLDRFVMLEWNYDEELERRIAPNEAWCDEVQLFRKAVAAVNGLRHMVTPRATIYGGHMVNAGVDDRIIRETVLYKGMSKSDREKVEAKLKELRPKPAAPKPRATEEVSDNYLDQLLGKQVVFEKKKSHKVVKLQKASSWFIAFLDKELNGQRTVTLNAKGYPIETKFAEVTGQLIKA